MTRRFIDELRISSGGEEELAGHQLTPEDALEVWWNGPEFFRDKVAGRDLMIGRNDGGSLLTIVIEPTAEYGAWDVVTGWRADTAERTAWAKATRSRGTGRGRK